MALLAVLLPFCRPISYDKDKCNIIAATSANKKFHLKQLTLKKKKLISQYNKSKRNDCANIYIGS